MVSINILSFNINTKIKKIKIEKIFRLLIKKRINMEKKRIY